MRRLFVVFLSIAAATAANAADYRILLPIYFEHPIQGAYGSVWEARFAIHDQSRCTYIIPWCSPPPGGPITGCILNLSADEELMPGETEIALPVRYPKPANGVAGAVVYIQRETNNIPLLCASANDSELLSFQLRIADLTRSATAAGTEVPVVRESSFRTSILEILDIPVDPRFRLVLRLFEMNLDRAAFAVRVYDHATNARLSSREVVTSTPPQGALRFQPGFAEITDLGTDAGNIRVEIEPLTNGAAFWSYVSVTNNDSQQVTLVTPQ
jgi:hypothetical protein